MLSWAWTASAAGRPRQGHRQDQQRQEGPAGGPRGGRSGEGRIRGLLKSRGGGITGFDSSSQPSVGIPRQSSVSPGNKARAVVGGVSNGPVDNRVQALPSQYRDNAVKSQ